MIEHLEQKLEKQKEVIFEKKVSWWKRIKNECQKFYYKSNCDEKTVPYNVPYTISGNGVIHVEASDILKSPKAQEQMRNIREIGS